MKRKLWVLPMIIILSVLIAIPASAAVITQQYSYDFVDDFSTVINDGNGDVTFAFTAYFLGAMPTAYAQVSIPSGCSGRTYSFIASYDVEARAAASNTINNNGNVVCGAALVNCTCATKSVHYANRKVNGTTTAWEYTYVSPHHEESPIELQLLNLYRIESEITEEIPETP